MIASDVTWYEDGVPVDVTFVLVAVVPAIYEVTVRVCWAAEFVAGAYMLVYVTLLPVSVDNVP